MKTSIKLLTGIAIAILLTMAGTAWSFRQQYDKLDHSDPYAQFTRQTLPPFRVLKLVGTPDHQFLIQPGSTSTLRIKADHHAEITYLTIGDTLLVRYVPASPNGSDGVGTGYAQWGGTIAVLTVPTLRTIQIENASCKLANWKLRDLILIQTGPIGATELANTAIGTLQATLSGKSLLSADGKNTIGQAMVTVNDSARFTVGTARFSSLRLRADSTATVTLPGSLLAKIR